MKKLASIVLALIMLLSAAGSLAEALPVEADTDLPQVGDVVYGFEVLEIREYSLIGADVVLFEHQKTGAKLTYVANGDNNRAFQLTFPTRPIDDTGLPHVFEHAATSGSDKYPSTSLWMNLAYQTYNTYMNAYTTDAMTCYPIASLSEAQLLKYADYYTDSCLHPLILRDESIYRTEAWRYRMASEDDDLTLEGTVYSEMQGAYTLARVALMTSNKITFPGSILMYDRGGNPDYIPDMTWDALKEYHARFYHPSNCMVYLYGHFEDYTAFLKMLDEAFAGYDRVEYTLEQPDYVRIEEPVVTKVAFPMAEGTDTANQSQIYYYIICPGMRDDVEQEGIIDNLCRLLGQDSSVLMQKLKEVLPVGSFSVGREVAVPDDAILFLATNVNEDDAELFKETVDAALREIAENGFPQDMVDSVTATLSLSAKLAAESSEPVDGVLESLAYAYAVTGNPFRDIEDTDNLFKIGEMNDQGLYQTAVSQWLLDQPLWTLTTTYPQPGGKEAHDAALAEKLAAIKAAMTEEEKQAVIDATNAEPAEDDASALVRQLQAVTVESLPEEVKIYPVSDETGEDGIRRIDVTAAVDGVGSVEVLLDAQAVPQEDLHWFRLFTRLLGQLDTDQHTKAELDVLTTRYLYNRTIGIATIRTDDGCHSYLCLEWTAMDEDLDEGYDLMEELVYHTQFTDTQKLLEKVQAQKASVRSTINSNSYSVMLYRGMGVSNPMYRYYSYINHVEYYAFLEQLEAMLEETPEAVTARFESLQAFFANNAGAVSGFAGNEESIAVNRALADQFLAKLPHQELEPVVYDLPVASEREALIIDGNVQFNNVIASLEDVGLEDFDDSLNVISSLVADKILVPILRDQYGVYTPLAGAVEDGGLYLITYRDPNIRETFDVYASLPELISQVDVDQETLDGYILNNYSGLAMGSGELAGARSVIDTTLSGRSQEKPLEYMRQLKAVTPEKVRAAAELYQKLWDNGVRSTSGSAGAINANADLYGVILNPFNTQDTASVELTDAAEGSEHYEAVRFVFENGIMSALTDDTFGVAESATIGDMAAGIYAAVGGPMGDPQGAVDWLASYGLLDAATDINTELTEETLCFVFVNGLGLSLSTDDPEAIVTRGDLADLFFYLFAE